MGRTSQEINQEYTNVCAEFGDLEYRFKYTVPKRLEALEHKLEQLQHEANMALKEEAAKNAQPAK